jgi:transposase-like protein
MMREQFVNEVLAGEKNKSELCREYGISRVTGDKWLARYQNGESFEDRSRSPFHTPNKTPSKTEELILSVRTAHPAWGARKILAYLLRRGALDLPGRSTIDAILKRNNCITEQASRAAKPFKRFQRETCNELWQTDFKGDFAMLDGHRCYPLTVLDDCSRFSLCIDAKDNMQRDGVLSSFERIFKTYGIPDTILCDNGNPWGNSQTTGYTKFEIWMMDLIF